MKKEAKRKKKEAKRMKKEKASREKGSTDSSADDDDDDGDGDQDERKKTLPNPQDRRSAVLDAASSQRNQGKKTKRRDFKKRKQ